MRLKETEGELRSRVEARRAANQKTGLVTENICVLRLI